MSDQDQTPFTTKESVAPATQAGTQDPVTPATPAPFQIPDSVAGLVGEGKKYATPEKALEALVHAQTHIERLESENAAYKENATKVKTAEELLEEIKATADSSKSDTPAPQVDEGLIDRIVEAKITAQEQARTAKQNVDTVVKQMTKEFGDSEKANEVYKAKAAELGLSIAQLNQMSAQSPTAVFSMFGLAKSEPAPAGKTRSDVITESGNLQQQPPAKPKSIMSGATAQDLKDAWAAAKPN